MQREINLIIICTINTPSNAIVNVASNISYRPLFLTNVVIGKLGKLVHKQNCSHDLFFILYIASLLYKLDTLLMKLRKLPLLDITGFFFCMTDEYSGEAHEGLHTSAFRWVPILMRKKKPVISDIEQNRPIL